MTPKSILIIGGSGQVSGAVSRTALAAGSVYRLEAGRPSSG